MNEIAIQTRLGTKSSSGGKNVVIGGSNSTGRNSTSWKWLHESPSLEPENLAPIDNIQTSLLETTDVDFTPSEIDDLETIELSTS
ncbi:Fc.00g036200.m01.CDS01 [Cosmosporella sp. VM-42]